MCRPELVVAGGHKVRPYDVGARTNACRRDDRPGRRRGVAILPRLPVTSSNTVSPALVSLIALQELDTAAEAARKRLAELPAIEQQLVRTLGEATASLDQVKARLAENQQARRELEKRVAVVESRLARFDEHKAAVKTNQEFTALLHEIETAKTEKDAIEEQIIGLLESADEVSAEIATVDQQLAAVRVEADATRASLQAERSALDAELGRLAAARTAQTTAVDRPLLAKYEQLLKQRKMLAIAPLSGDICSACHVRLRPAVTQQVRRNTDIITCDSCQRILYALPPPPDAATAGAPPA